MVAAAASGSGKNTNATAQVSRCEGDEAGSEGDGGRDGQKTACECDGDVSQPHCSHGTGDEHERGACGESRADRGEGAFACAADQGFGGTGAVPGRESRCPGAAGGAHPGDAGREQHAQGERTDRAE